MQCTRFALKRFDVAEGRIPFNAAFVARNLKDATTKQMRGNAAYTHERIRAPSERAAAIAPQVNFSVKD